MSAADSTQPVRGVYVSASNVGYVPLNNYPTTTEYVTTDIEVPAPVAAAAPPSEEAPRGCRLRRRCFFSRCCNPVPFPRLACWSKLLLIVAVALAATSLGTQKWYTRSFSIDEEDPRAAELGYTVDYRERIGLFKVCYHLRTTPIPRENASLPAAEPIDEKQCSSVYKAFRPQHAPPADDEQGGDQPMPPPPADSTDPKEPTDGPDMPDRPTPMGYHHGGHHRGGRCRGALVFCATKGALIAALVFAVLAYIHTCIERRGCCVRRKKIVVVAQSVFVVLAVASIASAVLFAAAGSSSVLTKPAAGPLAETVSDVPAQLSFRFSCSFFLALGACAVAGLAAILFIVRSARMMDHINNNPPVPSS